MGSLKNLYGYDSTLYYITSYVFRLIAAVSFYPIIYYLTKNKLSAFFAILFFSITSVGLDTTNWVFNMPSYITVAFFNLFLYFFFLSREQTKVWLLLISGFFYYLAYVTVPIRMHGSLPFIILIEMFWFLKSRNLKTIKKIALRLALIIFIFLFIRFTGHSMGPPEEAGYRLTLGLTSSLDLLKQGRFDFIFHPLITLGSILVPDNLLPARQVATAKDLLISILLPVFIIFLIIVGILSKSIPFFTRHFWQKILGFGAIWTLVIVLIYKGNINTFSSASYLLLLSVAGYLLFVTISLIYKYFKVNNISDALFMGLVWSVLSFFFAWWWTPTSLFTTTHRYLVVSAVGITIVLATILSITLKQKARFPLYLFVFIILIHIFSTRIFLNHLVEIRGQQVSNKIWSQMSILPEITKDKTPSIFYFEGDNSNGDTMHDVITYGFPPHMALLYNLKSDNLLPFSLDGFKELSAAVTDGKNLPRFGYPAKPIPIDHVYAFKLEGRDRLINFTSQIRQKLLEAQ